MNVHFVVPSQTQTGTFHVIVWIIGGNATASINESDFTATITGRSTVPVQVISNKVVSGQTRVVLSVIPPAGQKGTITVKAGQNAFQIGSSQFPTQSDGITSNAVGFDTTGGSDAITWTVNRAVFFENGSKFTFEITFSEMLLGNTTNLSATSFNFFGAVTSNITVSNINDSYTQYRISGDVTRTSIARVLNLGIARNGARRFVFGGGSPSHSGTQWPDTDRLLATLNIPPLEQTPSPEDEEPRRPLPPVMEAPETLSVQFSELPSFINTRNFTALVQFQKNRTLQPINVAESEITSANFSIRDGNNVIAGATITRIEGQDNWRKLYVQLPANTTGAVYIRVLANTIYWDEGIGPPRNIDLTPAISYSTPTADPVQEETPVVENPTGPDETQFIAAAPMAPSGGGVGFDGPSLIIITPEAGQAIRISEFVNFNTDLVNVGRLVYHNNNFYTYDGGTRALYHVTKEDGTAERVGTALNFGVGESAPSTLFSYDGNLYLIGRTLRKVIRLNTDTGVGMIVGAEQISVVKPLGATVFQGQILLAAADGGGLFILDSSTWKTVRLPGNELYSQFNQMENDMVDMTVHQGKLYGIGDTNDRLFEIDPLTGKSIQVNPFMQQFGANITNMRGLASDQKDLYGTDNRENALFNIRTRGSLPGETSDIIFKFDKPVFDFNKADLILQWTTDDNLTGESDNTDGVRIGDLDPSNGERGTTFQLPVYHRPGYSGILEVSVLPGSAIQAAEEAGQNTSSSEPNKYGPPIPVTRRIPFKLTNTSVILSVPPTTVYSEEFFVQTATFTDDIQDGSFTESDVIIRTPGVTLSNFEKDSANSKIYSWRLDFDITVNELVEIGINSGSVTDTLGRLSPTEDRYVSFYVDQTAPEPSVDISQVTTLCEETFTIKDNHFLDDLLPPGEEFLPESEGDHYGGLFKGVLEYLKMDGINKSYAVVQVAKPNFFGEGIDTSLPAAAVLIEIDSNGCQVIETFEYALLAPRSLVQDGDFLYYFLGSHYAYEYLPQWTNPEPVNGVFTAPQFSSPQRIQKYSGEIYEIDDNQLYSQQAANIIASQSATEERSVLPDYFIRESNQNTISNILSRRGFLIKYNARTGQVVSRQQAWKSKESDPVTMNTGKAGSRTALRQTPGYGVHGGISSPMVVENNNVHLIPGFGDLRHIKSNLYKNSQRQDPKVEPVTNIDNWNWITYSKEVEKRLPLLETNQKTYNEVLKEMAATLFCYIGYDANRNLIFKFKEPKQALLRNPVSNNMGVASGRRNLALELKQPNIDVWQPPEKIVDVNADLSGGRIFAGASGVYYMSGGNTLRRINLNTGAIDQTWNITSFTGVANLRDVRRNNMFFYGDQIIAHIRLTNGNEGLYRVDLDNQTLTLIGTNPNSVRSVSTHFRAFAVLNGIIYGLASNVRSLYRFDATTAAATRIAQIDPRSWNPFIMFASDDKLWVGGRIDGQPNSSAFQDLWLIDPATARYGDPVPSQTTPVNFTWQWATDYLGTTIILYENTIYKTNLTGLVKVEDELISYAGVGGTEQEPVLLNIERGQRKSSIPNNHNIVPVYFIDHVISMNDDYFQKPILDLSLRLDASQIFNVIQISYASGQKNYTIDNSGPNDIKRTFELDVPLDKNQFEIVKWLAERYEAWYKDPQIVADATLESSFYLGLGDIVLIEEDESIKDGENLFQTVGLDHSVKGITTKAKFRQISVTGERDEFGHIADTQLVQNANFDQSISRTVQSAAIVAFARDPVPQGVRVNPDSGRIYGIARQIGDAGQTFRVSFSQIIDNQVERQDVTFTVVASRPPLWDLNDQYFYNTAPISIDLSTYVTGKAPITFSAIGTLPSWLTLSGTMLTGTNPRTSQMTARILATNADGSSEQRFVFATASDTLPVYGQAVYGTNVYPYEKVLPTTFSSLAPIWSIDGNYFFNTATINVDLDVGYIINSTIAQFSIIGNMPEWLTITGSRLTGTNPRTSLTNIIIRATNENGHTDRVFYFGRATDTAPQYGTTAYGTAYYI